MRTVSYGLFSLVILQGAFFAVLEWAVMGIFLVVSNYIIRQPGGLPPPGSTVGSTMKKWTNIAATITRVLDVGLKNSNIQYTQDNLLGVLG
jgi:hypothetical protein